MSRSEIPMIFASEMTDATYIASLSPDIQNLLGNEEELLSGWRINPALHPMQNRLNRAELLSTETDAYDLISPLLDEPILVQSLRSMDVLNGCQRQCDSCYIAAVVPSKQFSLSSLQKLFGDVRFIRMLQPDSLRFGNAGDIMDHPHAVEIIKLALRATEGLDAAQQEKQERHRIEIYINFRLKDAARIDELILLAEADPRLKLIISLPHNANDSVTRQFREFAANHPILKPSIGEDRVHSALLGVRGNIVTNAVAVSSFLHPIGRLLRSDAERIKLAHYGVQAAHNVNMAKTHFNPDGLWLQLYVGVEQSQTTKAYKILSPENIGKLAVIPFHPHFPLPPNWPGGRGVQPLSQNQTPKEFTSVRPVIVSDN